MTSERKIGRVFITGGSGFVGRNLIQALSGSLGVRDIRALVRSDAATALLPKVEGIRPIRGDIHDLDAMRKGMEGCSHVFHLAANISFGGPYEAAHRDNVIGTQNVIDCARAAGVQRLVHCSTEALLAGGSKLIRNADETWPLPPTDGEVYPYSRSKGEAEKVVLAANGHGGLETVSIRPRFIWGRGDTVILPQLVEQAKKGDFMWVDGGKFPTSRCHVRNVCEGAICAALRGRPGEAYFLTDGPGTDDHFRVFFTRLLATQGVTKPITKSIPFRVAWVIAFLTEWLFGLLRLLRVTKAAPQLSRQMLRLIGREVTVVDAKARREIGYVARVDTETGIKELADEYQSSAGARKDK